MARTLPFPLDQIQISITARQPKWKIEIFDVKSSDDTIGDVVRQVTASSPPTLAVLTGPRDFTGDMVQATITEIASDFVEGVSATTVQLQIADPNGLFDPFNTIGNPTGDGRWLRRGNVVRIKEGDARIDEDDWPITFTGRLVGQAGTLTSRDPGSTPQIIHCEAVGRESDFLKKRINSASFPIGTTYLTIATDIATNDMGLDGDEIEFAGFGSDTMFQPIQIGDETPMVSLARIMFVDGFVPKFDGRGVLTQALGLITGIPVRTYVDDSFAASVDRPFSKLDPPNSVTIRGLNQDMAKILQPVQVLATLSLTIGYFTQDETIEIPWSEDKTQLAQNFYVDTLRSVNGGLSFLGADEKFTEISSGPTTEGSVGVRCDFTTGFAPWLIVFFLVEYVILSWVPDEVVTVGFVGGVGVTVNVGSAAAAISLAIAMLIMMKIGRGNYAFMGEPFEFVHEEISALAELEGLLSEDIVELEIENHLISSQPKLDGLARDVLFEQQAKGNPRIFRMLNDLRLETNDEFRGLSGRDFKIKQLARTLIRTQDGGVAISTVNAFETTTGFTP